MARALVPGGMISVNDLLAGRERRSPAPETGARADA